MIDWLLRKWALYWLLRDIGARARFEAHLKKLERDMRRLEEADRWLGIQRVDEG